MWEIEHISAHTGVSARRGPGAHKACIAVDLRKPELVDFLLCRARGEGGGVPGAAGELSLECAVLLLRRTGRRALGTLCLVAGRPPGRPTG